MKKLFLFFAASTMIFSVVAQKPATLATPKKVQFKVSKTSLVEQQGTGTFTQNKPMGSNTKSVTPVLVGTSVNPWTVQYALGNLMSYNEQFDIIGFSHRGGPTNGTGGQIFNNFSLTT